MAIFVGTLALTGGTFVLGRYLMEMFAISAAKSLKGVDLPGPNPLWGAIGFTVAVLGGLLVFM